MPVTQYYPIGSITMPSSWIAFIAGFIVTYLFIRLRFGTVHSERVGNIFFNVVIVWKLSVILTDFSHVIKNPLSILYFHGGTFGWFLGLVVAALLMIRQVYKEKWQRMDQWSLLLALICWQAVFQVSMTLLNQGSMAVKGATVVLMIAVFIVVYWSERKKVNTVSELVGIFVAVHFLVSALQGNIVNKAMITTIFIGLLMWGVEKISTQPFSRREEIE